MLAQVRSIALAALVAGGCNDALASRDLVGCDILNIASNRENNRGGMGDDISQYYYDNLLVILTSAAQQKPEEMDNTLEKIAQHYQTVAERLVAAIDFASYLKSDRCVILTEFDLRAALDTYALFVNAGTPTDLIDSVKRVINANDQRLKSGLQSIRFRSDKDRELFRSGYYCSNASLVATLFFEKKMKMPSVQHFGSARSCKELSRDE